MWKYIVCGFVFGKSIILFISNYAKGVSRSLEKRFILFVNYFLNIYTIMHILYINIYLLFQFLVSSVDRRCHCYVVQRTEWEWLVGMDEEVRMCLYITRKLLIYEDRRDLCTALFSKSVRWLGLLAHLKLQT